MRDGWFSRVISGEKKSVPARLARVFLSCLSSLYGIALKIRRAAYALRIRSRYRPTIPVISVGNLTAGGTGKTPLVALVVNTLRRAGHRPVILSRGYKASGPKNDEASVLERLAPGVPNLLGKNRVKNARKAVMELGATALVLDDGFQHWRIARDLDIVAVDALNPFGFGRLLPRGLLREPTRALRRAHLFVVTHSDQVAPPMRELLKATLQTQIPGVPLALSRHKVEDVLRSGTGEVKKASAIKGKDVLAFCGIGNPRSFEATVRQLGGNPKMFMALGDHQHYPLYLLAKIEEAAEKLGVDAIVTTEKDAVKFDFWKGPRPVYVVRITLEIIEGADVFEALVLKAAGPAPTPAAASVPALKGN
jgi:tetraacyldisaccharide 4'-kinase